MKFLKIITLLAVIATIPTFSMVPAPHKPIESVSTYSWVKRIPLEQAQSAFGFKSRTKLTLKTKSADWVNTSEPILLVFSIHSKFHQGPIGEFQAKNFIAGIKEHVKSKKVTVLLAENAHAKAISLRCNNNLQEASNLCVRDAHALAKQLQPHLDGCDVQFWNTMISNDPDYPATQKRVQEIYATDKQFQHLLRDDAQSYYTSEREKETPDKDLFITKTVEDLLELAVYNFIVAKQGYRFEFYPGKPNSSSEYLKRTYIKPENKVTWVHMFLNFE